MRPATSDMGVSSGSSPFGSCTVSYAMKVAPLSTCALVSTSSAAKWKYVKIVCPRFMRGHSTLIGSFTLRIMSASFHVASASGAIVPPAFTYSSSGKPLPSPAPFSIRTVCPSATNASQPAGTSATRFSFVLISFGTPIRMNDSGWSSGERARARRLRCGTETQNGLTAGRIKFGAHLRDGLRGGSIDERQRLLERTIWLVVQRDASRAVHPRRHAFQRQRHLPLQLALPGAHLLLRERVLGQLVQLLGNRLLRTRRGLRRCADVHARHAGVRMEALERVHGIRERQLLADSLKEARAHAAAEDRVDER